MIILEEGMFQKSPRIPIHGKERGAVGEEGAERRRKRNERGSRRIGQLSH